MKLRTKSQLLAALLVANGVQAATYTDTFDGSGPSSSWSVVSNPGYSVQFTGGQGAFSKTNNSPNGSVVLTTNFLIDGDFIIRVDTDGRFDGSLSEFLTVDWVGSSSFAQVWLETPQLTYHALGISPTAYNSNGRQTITRQVKFQITRVGTTVSLAVDRGQGGYETFLGGTNAAFSGPVVAQLTASDYDSGSNAGGTAYFDNFFVQATTITAVPEPKVSALLMLGLLLMMRHLKKRAAAA